MDTNDTGTSKNSINDTSAVSEKSTNDTSTVSEKSTNDTSESAYTNENSTDDRETSEIDTIYGKKLRITCSERKYKVVDEKVSFFIVTRKEFDEDRTEKMLHEDMELKTFLANYEIMDITFPSSSPYSSNENIKNQKKKTHEMGKFEIGKKEESEATKKRRDIIMNTLKRRELFDSLDLPKEFLVRDYIDAVEKNGIKISNSAMPYDDLRWLAKKGKVEMIKKVDHGVVSYRMIKKTGNVEIESQQENDQLEIDQDETPLPSKHSIDRCID